MKIKTIQNLILPFLLLITSNTQYIDPFYQNQLNSSLTSYIYKAECPNTFEPVCSEGNQTFQNPCSLEKYGFKLKNRGPCINRQNSS